MPWPPDVEFCLIDFETTGLHPMTDRITEYAYSIVKNGLIIDTGSQLINPMMPIGPRVSALTGITNEMVSEEPVFSSVGNKLWHVINNRILVAHNASFDVRFLIFECSRLNWSLPNFVAVDSLKLARSIFPNNPNHKLGYLADLIGHKWSGDAHRAMADVEALFSVLDFIFKQHGDKTGTMEKLVELGGLEYPNLTDVNSVRRSEKANKIATQIGRGINITYESKNSGLSNRRVTPIEVLADGKNEFFNAFCERNGEVRTFNIERLHSIDVLEPDQENPSSGAMTPPSANGPKPDSERGLFPQGHSGTETSSSEEPSRKLILKSVSPPPEFIIEMEDFLTRQIELLNSEDFNIRKDAAYQLSIYTEEFDEREWSHAFTPSESLGKKITSALSHALSDPTPDVRSMAAFSLGCHKGRFDEKSLLYMLKDTDPGVRESALTSLSMLEIEGGVPLHIILDLFQDSSDEVRDLALQEYCDMGYNDPEQIKTLLEGEGGRSMRRAMRALANTGDKVVIKWILPYLEAEDKNVQIAAATSLASLGNNSGIDILIDAIKYEDEHDYDQYGLVRAIAKLGGDDRATEIFSDRLRRDRSSANNDTYHRMAAVGLKMLGTGREALTHRFFTDAYSEGSLCNWSHFTIIEALREIGDKESEKALHTIQGWLQLRKKRSEQILKKCQEAIKELSDRSSI